MKPAESLPPSERELLERSEALLDYRFRDPTLLVEALTHASSSQTRLNSWERLEFLGDSILGFVVCEHLFYEFPSWLEGDLTRIKSVVVSRQTCARIAGQMQLEELLVVGKGLGQNGSVPDSLLANSFESILGAIYLDGGLEAAKDFLLPYVRAEVRAAVEGRLSSNYKSDLQQLSQKRFGLPPHYELLGERGPDHDKWFLVSATVDDETYPPAWGKNKKEAEQRAAANALAEIEGVRIPFPEDRDDSPPR